MKKNNQSGTNRPKFQQDNDDFPSSLGYVRNGKSTKKRRNKKNKHLLWMVGVSLTIAALLIVWATFSHRNPFDSHSESSSSNTSLDESLSSSEMISVSSSSSQILSDLSGEFSSDVDSSVRASKFKTLKASITDYTDQFDGRIGMYYINLVNGETFGVNETDPFVAASSIKLSIATQFYKNIAAGTFELTDMLAYDNRPYPTGDMEYGTGIIINEPNGTEFSMRRTAQLAITISDNCATNMMIRKLGGIDNIVAELYPISDSVKYRESITYTDYKGAIISGRHRISALDLALYAANFHALWTESKEDYQPLMDDLQSTLFDFGIQKNLPAEVKVAHKIGTNFDWRTENDVGIVFADETYVLCVTTESLDQTIGRLASADISLIIYQYISDLNS